MNSDHIKICLRRASSVATCLSLLCAVLTMHLLSAAAGATPKGVDCCTCLCQGGISSCPLECRAEGEEGPTGMCAPCRPTLTPQFTIPQPTPTRRLVTPTPTVTATSVASPTSAPTNTKTPRATPTNQSQEVDPTPRPPQQLTKTPSPTPDSHSSSSSSASLSSRSSSQSSSNQLPDETPVPTPTPSATPTIECWQTDHTMTGLGVTWQIPKVNTACIPHRAMGCLPGANGQDCYAYRDRNAGAGCGGLEARISCADRKNFFSDPLNTGEKEPGLVAAE